MPSLIIDLKYQLKRLYKKLLTVFCLLIMPSLGFTEGGIQPSNKGNIKILQQENLIKSQQLNNERKMKIQAQKELEDLKKTNEEQGAQTIDNQCNAGNSSQGINTGQGLPNQQSSEAEQYQLSAKNKQSSSQEIESSNSTVPATTDLGDELSTNNDSRFSVSNNTSNLLMTVNETKTPIADNLSMQEAGTDSNVNNPNAMADTSDLLAQLEETTNELMDTKNLLKSMEENFQQEREQFREALDQNTLKYQQDTEQLKEQLSTEKQRADQATNDKNLAEQKTEESDAKLTVAENTIDQLRQDLEKSDLRSTQLNEQLEQTKQDLQLQEVESARLTQESQTNKENAENLNRALNQANSDLEQKRIEAEETQKSITKLRQEIDTAKENVKRIQLEKDQIAQELITAQTNSQEQKTTIERLTEKSQRMEQALVEATNNVENSKIEAAQLKERINTLEKDALQNTAKIEELEDDLIQKDALVVENQKEVERIQGELEQENAQLQEALSQVENQLKNAQEELEHNLIKNLDGGAAQNTSQIELFQDELVQKDDSIRNIQEKYQYAQQKVHNQKTISGEITAKYNKLAGYCDQLGLKYQDSQKKLRRQGNNVATNLVLTAKLTANLQDLKRRNLIIITENQTLSKRVAQDKETITNLQAALGDKRQTIEAKDKEITELYQDLESKTQREKELDRTVQSLMKENTKLQSEIDFSMAEIMQDLNQRQQQQWNEYFNENQQLQNWIEKLLPLEEENKALTEEINDLTSIATNQQAIIDSDRKNVPHLEKLNEELDQKNDQLKTLKQEKTELASQFNAYADDAKKTCKNLRQELDKARTEAQGLKSKMAKLSALDKRATHNSRSVSPSQRLHTFNHSEASSRRDSTASTLASPNPSNIRPVNQQQTLQEKQHSNIRRVLLRPLNSKT